MKKAQDTKTKLIKLSKKKIPYIFNLGLPDNQIFVVEQSKMCSFFVKLIISLDTQKLLVKFNQEAQLSNKNTNSPKLH